MTTDKLLDAWKRWVQRGTSLPVAMRDDATVKQYPGIYIEGDSASRFESGGVQDSNTFTIEWDTKLVTTPARTRSKRQASWHMGACVMQSPSISNLAKRSRGWIAKLESVFSSYS